MKKKENEMIEKNDMLDFEDEVTARVEGNADSAIAEELPAESAEEPVIVDAAPIEVSDSPASEESAPTEEADLPRKEYGAPQPLFEDIIPADYAADRKQDKKSEKEIAAEAKKAEKEAAIAAKKKEKEDKKKAKIAALIAKTEADAEAKAVAEIERETGEHYEMPKEETTQEAPTPVAVAAVAAPAKKAEPKSKANAAEKTGLSKQYQRSEKKLRRKYKMDKDMLLSSNDVVPGFVIAKGETVIRTYNCLAAKKGDGTLRLTSKRLLINAGERSEIGIDRVSGIRFCKYSNFSFLKFLFWLIFFALGGFMVALPFIYTGVEIPGITGDSWQSWFAYLFYACGAVSLLISIPIFVSMTRKSFYFNIYAQEEAPFFECKSGFLAKREKKGKVYKFLVANPGSESEKAARELGALILEAKAGRYDF